MKSLSASYLSELAGDNQNRALMVKIIAANGTAITATTHDKPLTVDLGDGDGFQQYLPSYGISPSELAMNKGFATDDVELVGEYSDLIEEVSIAGGLYTSGDVYLFEVVWDNLAAGLNPKFKGYISHARSLGDRFTLIVKSEIQKFQQTQGRVITAYCTATHGDDKCKRVVPDFAGQITSVTDSYSFVTDVVQADDFFTNGELEFTSGDLTGVKVVKVFAYLNTGAVTLWTPPPLAPEVGDNIIIREGCPKTLPACVARSNAINFRAYPFFPGSDAILTYQLPQSS